MSPSTETEFLLRNLGQRYDLNPPSQRHADAIKSRFYHDVAHEQLSF